MKKAVLAIFLALALFSGSTMIAAPARADDAGAAVAAGIGGLALGAIVGGALARPAPPVYYYPAPTPVYIAPPPPRCWTESRPVFDEYGYVVGYRPRRICE